MSAKTATMTALANDSPAANRNDPDAGGRGRVVITPVYKFTATENITPLSNE